MPEPSIPTATTPAAPAWRDALLAVVAGVACYALSCLLVAPADVAVTFGAQWEDMSRAPFELRGQFPHRILAPLLANGLGLGGEHFVGFVRGLAVLLLATVFFFCRRHGAALVDALLVTLAIAVTASIQMYKQHWVGFVDPLCYTLFFWAWLAARRALLFWPLFFANLLNHELAVFLLPWLWFVRRRANGSWRVDAIGSAVAIGLYGAFYFWVKANALSQKYHAGYFTDNPLFPGGTFIVVCLALAHLTVAFGPVLAVLAWHQRRPEFANERLHLRLVLVGIFVIFCIAFDWARHANLIVLPLVLASVRFLAAGHRVVYAAMVVLGVGLMLWKPPWSSGWPMDAMASVELWRDTGTVIANPRTGEPGAGPLSAALTKWLPAIWPILTTVLGILAAIWLAGALFARRHPAPEPAATADRAA
jgi:hypothetical protein